MATEIPTTEELNAAFSGGRKVEITFGRVPVGEVLPGVVPDGLRRGIGMFTVQAPETRSNHVVEPFAPSIPDRVPTPVSRQRTPTAVA